MALQNSITFDNQINVSSAYIRICRIDFEYSNPTHVIIRTAIYFNQTAYNNGSPEITSLEHVCKDSDYDTYLSDDVLNLVDNNPTSQSYEWLKTLPMYSGSIDI